jgi:cytochrome c oxidase subunit 2
MSVKHNNKLRSLSMLALLFGSGSAMAGYQYNFQTPVTPVGRDIFDLHMLIFWICVAIAVLVFSVMFISLVKHRKSKGAVAADFHENTTIEILWTVIPLAILIAIAIPATKTLIKIEDTKTAELTIKVTGNQWFWEYEYQGTGVKFASYLKSSHKKAAGYDKKDRQAANRPDVTKIKHYLQDVSEPLVLPAGTKIRILTTAKKVIHSWWVPAFAVKRDAIPGVVNASWTKIDEDAIGKTFRGECAELCGKGHAFMPIVVKVVSKEDFKKYMATKIAAVEKEKALAASNKVWSKADLMARGKQKYAACAGCHGATGAGGGPFPPLTGSKIVNGSAVGHIKFVLKGKNAMPPFAHMSDLDLAAILTYERNALGNNKGDIIQPADVKAAR